MVKCADCGFLAVRHHSERYLAEVEGNIREGGEWPVQRGGGIPIYERRPLCFAMSEQIGVPKDDYSPLDFKEHIHEKKDCKEFTEWQQGFTPKEHREMLDRQEFRDWQEKQSKSDRLWRIIESIVFILVAGGFTVLGALIAKGSIP